MTADNAMRTPWSPQLPIPLPEYPRPQMTRPRESSAWVNLNGLWEYALLPKENPPPRVFDGQILVPFPVESLLSGVQRPLLPAQSLWYRRFFENPLSPAHQAQGQRLLLHFGAVDYHCQVWVNGQSVGEHIGGYLPFTFDITSALVAGGNELLVSVWDPTDAGLQPRGKQVLRPRGIWYTPVSGIWQTVWLETVPAVSIAALRLTPDLDRRVLTIQVYLRGALDLTSLHLFASASSQGKVVASADARADSPLILEIPEPRLWTPDSPHLYDLRLRLMQHGQVLDEVASYFTMRKFSLLPDAAGHLRFALNNKPLFLYGPLDQGYFPDGLYTPPSDAAMLFDLEYTRKIGCNLVRKHVKVEPLRWYHHCDRLGLIVWQDMPNGGCIDGDVIALLASTVGFHRADTRRLSRFGRSDPENRAAFLLELAGMIDHLYNSPCIAAWVPFNESWGQFNACQVADKVKSIDPTRLVDHASGWFDQGCGDFLSRHIYVRRLKPPRRPSRAFAVTEAGGYSLAVPGHLWDPSRKFGYRFYDSPARLQAAYQALLEEQVMPLIPHGLTALVYTQTTDVEIEINGYLTYDRRVEKMDSDHLLRLHKALIEAGSRLQSV